MTDIDIAKPPAAPEYLRFAESFGRRFLVTVDTEEEFDWDAPIARANRGVSAVPALRTFQEFCEGFGVAPLYLVDHPVATAAATRDALGDAIATGRADIGVHLHPWVSPPFDEDVCEANSFAGNLPPALEREKFAGLHAEIGRNLGVRPLIYRAGRYGVGPGTAAMLHAAGLSIDSSVRPLFDYGAGGGPDFSRHPQRPYWLDREGGMIELPLTVVRRGALRNLGDRLDHAARRWPRLTGVLAKARLLDRIPLTPEGISADEAIAAIDIALADGFELLMFSFHSPSLAPGHTPYVRSEADLARFYGWWRRIFTHLADRQVKPAGVGDVLAAVALA